MKNETPIKKLGRPPILTGETVMASVRMSKAQLRAIEQASRKQDKPKSEWMRETLAAAAAKILDATGIEPASPRV